jgi:hypothetical protein
MIEVLKQALEALELCDGAETADGVVIYTNQEITSLRQAIAELESQEPVAYLCENAVGHKYFRWKKPTSIYKPIALYTHPPQRTWVGLTRMDLIKCGVLPFGMSHELCQAIEAKLKEKNT